MAEAAYGSLPFAEMVRFFLRKLNRRPTTGQTSTRASTIGRLWWPGPIETLW